MNFSYPMSAQYLTNCMLNVTDDCNLQCKYCFVQQQPNYMTLDIAIKTVNWLYKNYIKKQKLGIINNTSKIELTFFGGEPMLCYSTIIQPIVEYCNNNYPNLFEFGITSNGTLFTKENLNFLRENNFNILLSVDGNEETQNFNRPCKNPNQNSFDLIKDILPYLLENFPNTCFRSTIYAPTVKNLFENYLFAEIMGFKNWEAIIDNRHEWSNTEIQELKDQFSNIYLYRLSQIIENKNIMNWEFFNNYLLETLKICNNKINKYNEFSINRCGLGTISGSIRYDGKIFGCQERPSIDDINSIFYIGDIENGINIKKHYQLLSTFYNNKINIKLNETCNNCNFNSFCKINLNNCLSTDYDLSNNFNYISNIDCQMRKIYFNNSLLILKIIFSLNNKDIINKLLKGAIE